MLRRVALIGLVLLAVLVATAVALDSMVPPPLDRLSERSVLVADRNDEILRAFTTPQGTWRLPTAADEVSPDYLAMLFAIEDRRFYWHPGVDPLAALRAAGQILVQGRVVSGASTLTMQVVRLLEPRPRTLRSKLIEAGRALQLEWRLGKSAILSAYLTLAPMGGNLEGVRAGSLAWFGKEPQRLSPAEVALLVALPQAPARLRPDNDPEAAKRARDRVLRRVAAAGLLAPADLASALAAPVPNGRQAMPFHAPHLAERLAAQATSDEVIRTTLDGPLQRAAERVLAEAASLQPMPINLAALIVEHGSGAVRTHIGSANYFEPRRAGMVDLTTAVRSPGSTLKPFAYGLAFDALLAHPASIVRDAASRFDDYAPANFDGGFDGDVTVREALQRSLNLPAVTMLEQLGPVAFVRRLSEAGIALTFGSDNVAPALPVILGGVGTTLHDLATGYTGLARGGEVTLLRVLDAARSPAVLTEPGVLLGREAATAVTDVLLGVPRPAGLTAGGRAIAYKTGTSYRFRDGWAVGYDGAHTVAVWIGRPDGASCRSCNGPAGAAPVLFRLFDLLPETRLAGLPLGSLFAGPPPPGLARLDRKLAPEPSVERLRIAFPPSGTTLLIDSSAHAPDRARDAFQLTVEGGRRPYRWLVDDVLLGDRTWRRAQAWNPHGPGFTSLKVVDADGRSDEVAIRLKRRDE